MGSNLYFRHKFKVIEYSMYRVGPCCMKIYSNVFAEIAFKNESNKGYTP